MRVRVSRGRFDTAHYDEVRALLDAAREELIPAIEELPGMIGCQVGVDRDSGTVINLSFWETEDQARAMDTLAPLLTLRQVFTTRGVTFEPIVSYDVLWRIERPGRARRSSAQGLDRPVSP